MEIAPKSVVAHALPYAPDLIKRLNGHACHALVLEVAASRVRRQPQHLGQGSLNTRLLLAETGHDDPKMFKQAGRQVHRRRLR